MSSPLSQPVSPTPTVLATILATSILAGIVGYYLGLGSTLSLSRNAPPSSTKPSGSDSDSVSDSDSGSGSESEPPTSDIKSFSDVGGECKLVLVVRTDLPMTKGKTAAQCSHATLACYKSLRHSNATLLRRWERTGQAKITLQANGEEELVILQAQAQSLGITARIVHDAGRTQIAAGSATVLGIGPAPKTVIDQITGHLKLL